MLPSAVAAAVTVSAGFGASFLPAHGAERPSFSSRLDLPPASSKQTWRVARLCSVIIYLFFNGDLKAAIRDDLQASLADTR